MIVLIGVRRPKTIVRIRVWLVVDAFPREYCFCRGGGVPDSIDTGPPRLLLRLVLG